MESKWDKVGKDVTHLPPGEGTRSLWVLGELVAYKITSYQTGGAYSLFEVETPPGSGVPPHVQHREDEAFCILEGEYEFLVEGRTIKAGAGSLIYVPKGNLHAHINVGEGTARMLVSQTPGGLHERFFDEIGEEMKDRLTAPVSEDPPDMERIAKIAAEYGIEIPSRPVGGPKGRESRHKGGHDAEDRRGVNHGGPRTTALRARTRSCAGSQGLLHPHNRLLGGQHRLARHKRGCGRGVVVLLATDRLGHRPWGARPSYVRLWWRRALGPRVGGKQDARDDGQGAGAM